MKSQTFISIIAVCCFQTLRAQVAEHQVIDRGGNNGTLTYIFQHDEIHGTQFLTDTWLDASITTDHNYTFTHMSVKFDVYNNKFIYKLNDTAYELGAGIKMICIFNDPADTSKKQVFKNGYPIDNHLGTGKFLEVLAEGPVTLLKYYSKEVEEYNEYGNANKLKRFKDLQRYYILADGKYTAVSINRKSLEQVLQSKWTQIESYLGQKKISGKNVADWTGAIIYYNSL